MIINCDPPSLAKRSGPGQRCRLFRARYVILSGFLRYVKFRRRLLRSFSCATVMFAFRRFISYSPLFFPTTLFTGRLTPSANIRTNLIIVWRKKAPCNTSRKQPQFSACHHGRSADGPGFKYCSSRGSHKRDRTFYRANCQGMWVTEV